MGDVMMHPVILAPGRSGLLQPFAAPFGSRARKRIAIGLDSLGSSGGAPGLADSLRTHFTATRGDAGAGFMALDHATIAARMAGGDFSLGAGFSNIAALSWDDPRLRKSMFGKGLVCNNTVTDETLATDYLLLSGPDADIRSIDLYFEWSKAGQSFRIRQWPTEVAGDGCFIRQADYPALGVVHKVTFLLDVGGIYSGKGINLERIACCGDDIFFWATEFHGDATGQDGVQIVDVGVPSARSEDWAGLDAARTRMWAKILQPDVFIIIAGMNDRGAASQTDLVARRTAARFSIHLDAVIDRLQECPRTNIVIVRPLDPADVATTAIRYFDRVLRAAAWAKGCAFHDERDVLGEFEAANAAGYMSVDGVHPSTLGNAIRAQAIALKLAKFGA